MRGSRGGGRIEAKIEAKKMSAGNGVKLVITEEKEESSMAPGI